MHVEQVVLSGKLSGNGQYTQLCQDFFTEKFGFKKCLLTTSCTDALEMCALLLDLKPGEEVIVPSFTFVSTALAFAGRGAKIVFADSQPDNPNIDVESVKSMITEKTRAVVVMHYAGYACRMDELSELLSEKNIFLIEDAALSLGTTFNNAFTGSFGHFSAFSFHETKNIMCGEGGMLVINDELFADRAKILWEKGTNRVDFAEGKAKKYEWVDFGSSFLPSELIAAFLYGQLNEYERIQNLRKNVWILYAERLTDLKKNKFINFPDYYSNGSMFHFFVLETDLRDKLLTYLQLNGINAVFHYLPLHLSPFYLKNNKIKSLPFAENFAASVVRLPFFPDLKKPEIEFICRKISDFFENQT